MERAGGKDNYSGHGEKFKRTLNDFVHRV